MIAAAGLDWLIGDPLWSPHPVVGMGLGIERLRQQMEHWAGDRPRELRLSGYLITSVLVLTSVAAGWLIERLWLQSSGHWRWASGLLLVVALASALAARSLHDGVMAVVKALPAKDDEEPSLARERLSWIVGRDTKQLSREEILRAAAETASENAVDGVFAPLFWMLVGVVLWSAGLLQSPGPLALAWGFKASSTLDSMLGYKRGRLRWLGTAGARLDDALTWVPCRMVMLTLPLISRSWRLWLALVLAAERDGALDPSPNAGRSEAIYAHCAGVQLGGRNRYGDTWITKPLLKAGGNEANPHGVRTILSLSARLQWGWIVAAGGLSLLTQQ